MNKIAVNQLALSSILARFAAIPQWGGDALDFVQLRAQGGGLDVSMIETGVERKMIVRPFFAVSVSIPAPNHEPDAGLALEVEVEAIAELLKTEDAGGDVATLEISKLDGVSLQIDQRRPGPLGGFQATIPYYLPRCPAVAEPAWDPILAMNAERFVERLALTLPAAAYETGEAPELAFVTLKGADQEMFFAATDKHRLHIAGIDGGFKKVEPIQIPAQIARELPELLAGSKMVELSVNREARLLKIYTLFNDMFPFSIIVGISTENVPDYDALLEIDVPIILTVNGPAFAEALRRARAVSDHVQLTVRPPGIDLLAGEPGLEEATLLQRVAYSVDRKPALDAGLRFSMHIDAEYVLDALGAAQGALSLCFADCGENPINVEAVRVMSRDLLAIVMPRRP
ncbi:MAG: hypothetical protein GWN87_24980 [Desulfuromonadales bacterium]|nr:hypothetical protein [Desulfuromonadales bacterium]